MSLAAAKDKISQTDITVQRRATAIEIGMPTFPKISARAVIAPIKPASSADLS